MRQVGWLVLVIFALFLGPAWAKDKEEQPFIEPPASEQIQTSAEVLRAIAGGNSKPSARAMTELLWMEPAVQACERGRAKQYGQLVMALGSYRNDQRDEFTLTVWRMTREHSFLAFYSVERRAGHWRSASPFFSEPQAGHQALAHFMTCYSSEAAYVPPMDTRLADQLFAVWQELDGRYADRVLVEPGRWSNESVDTARLGVRHAVVGAKYEEPTHHGVVKLPYNQAMLVLWDREGSPVIGGRWSLWRFQNEAGKWILREYAVVPRGGYPSAPSDSPEWRIPHRLAVLPVNVPALAQGGAQQLFTLAELGRSEVGQLTTRFLRMAGLNNRQDLDGYCEGTLAGAVWNDEQWRAFFEPLTALAAEQILIEQDQRGVVQVHCGSQLTLVGSYRKEGVLTFNRVIRPAKVNAVLPRTKAERTVRTVERVDHARVYPARSEAERRRDYGVPLAELPAEAKTAVTQLLNIFRRGDVEAYLAFTSDYDRPGADEALVRTYVEAQQVILNAVDNRDIRVTCHLSAVGGSVPTIVVHYPKSQVAYASVLLLKENGRWCRSSVGD